MAKVSVSILSADFVNLERDIHDIEKSQAEWIHIDVMDGVFVPNLTIGLPVVKAIRGVTNRVLDVHLMIDRPIRYVEQFVASGADWLTIHIEADTRENTISALKKIREMGCHPGISVNPDTTAEEIEPYLSYCDLVLIMTVQAGFGGQAFRSDMMSKLYSVRKRLDAVNPGCMLSVDGGVDSNTAPICRKNGADVLVTGSAYFRSAERAVFVSALQEQ